MRARPQVRGSPYGWSMSTAVAGRCSTSPRTTCTERYPNLVLVHLPVHASWLDQIEIYFSILQRKVLTPNDSVSLDELGGRILAFQARYEESGHALRVEVHPAAI